MTKKADIIIIFLFTLSIKLFRISFHVSSLRDKSVNNNEYDRLFNGYCIRFFDIQNNQGLGKRYQHKIEDWYDL